MAEITLDSIDLKTYGVLAIRGSYNDLVRIPDLKEVSSYSWPTEDFDDVDLNDRKMASRDISLTFLLSGEHITDMMDYRDALINVLKADGARSLSIAALGKTYQIYYKSCESAQFINASKKRIKMVLKFRLTGE